VNGTLNHGEPRLSCAVHPSTPEETIEIRCHQYRSTIKEASKTEKMEHPEEKKVEKIFLPVHFSDESAKQ